MPASTAQLREDFDRIALLAEDPSDHNARYHGFLIDQLPPSFGTALDIGCGTGAFSRLLAARADHVLGLDLSPKLASARAAFRMSSFESPMWQAGPFRSNPSIASLLSPPFIIFRWKAS